MEWINWVTQLGYYNSPLNWTQIFSCTLQDLPIQSTCKTCPEGYYCDSGIAGGVSNYTQYICPEGSYCPAGTTHAAQHTCPLGTFNNVTGKKNIFPCNQTNCKTKCCSCQIVKLNLNHNLLNYLSWIIHLPFLELFITIFSDIKMRTWSWSANSIEPDQTVQICKVWLVARADHFQF